MSIEQRAKDFIAVNGWTQEQLASAVGIHPVTLCRILRKPRKREDAREKLQAFLASYELKQQATEKPE